MLVYNLNKKLGYIEKEHISKTPTYYSWIRKSNQFTCIQSTLMSRHATDI